MFDSFLEMHYVEIHKLWYNDAASGERVCFGQTENFDRAEAVEMFLWENGYFSVRIETVRVYTDGSIGESVISYKRSD